MVTMRYKPLRGDLNHDGSPTSADAATMPPSAMLRIPFRSRQPPVRPHNARRRRCQWRQPRHIPRRSHDPAGGGWRDRFIIEIVQLRRTCEAKPNAKHRQKPDEKAITDGAKTFRCGKNV